MEHRAAKSAPRLRPRLLVVERHVDRRRARAAAEPLDAPFGRGIGRARELCYTADTLSAEEALRIGLVNAVVPHAELMTKVREVATKIASKGPLAVAQAKRALLRGADVPLPVACELEAQAFGALFGSADQREGMAAFLGKRTAAFRGA